MMIYKCYISVNDCHFAAKSSRNAYEMYTASDHRVLALNLPRTRRRAHAWSPNLSSPGHEVSQIKTLEQLFQQTKQCPLDGLGAVAKAPAWHRAGMVEVRES
jgi:hypothetical protein